MRQLLAEPVMFVSYQGVELLIRYACEAGLPDRAATMWDELATQLRSDLQELYAALSQGATRPDHRALTSHLHIEIDAVVRAATRAGRLAAARELLAGLPDAVLAHQTDTLEVFVRSVAANEGPAQLDELLSLTDRLPGHDRRSAARMISRAAVAAASAGQLDQARDLTNRLAGDDLFRRTGINVASAYVAAGHPGSDVEAIVDDAERWVREEWMATFRAAEHRKARPWGHGALPDPEVVLDLAQVAADMGQRRRAEALVAVVIDAEVPGLDWRSQALNRFIRRVSGRHPRLAWQALAGISGETAGSLQQILDGLMNSEDTDLMNQIIAASVTAGVVPIGQATLLAADVPRTVAATVRDLRAYADR